MPRAAGHHRCNTCEEKFGRRSDLRRHENTIHGATVFWCLDPTCSRSKSMQGKPFKRQDKRNEHHRKKHQRVNRPDTGIATPSSSSSDDLDLQLNFAFSDPTIPSIQFPPHDLVQMANGLLNNVIESETFDFRPQGEQFLDVSSIDFTLSNSGSFGELVNGFVAGNRIHRAEAWDLADQFDPSLFTTPVAKDVNGFDNNMFADVVGGIELHQSVMADENTSEETAAAAAQAPWVTDARWLQPVMRAAAPWNMRGNFGEAISLLGSQGSNGTSGSGGSIRCQHCGNHVL